MKRRKRFWLNANRIYEMLVPSKRNWFRGVAQLVGVAAAAAVMTMLTEPHQSWLNALWIFGIPVLVGILFNTTTRGRLLMCLLLIVISTAAAISTAAYFGFGP